MTNMLFSNITPPSPYLYFLHPRQFSDSHPSSSYSVSINPLYSIRVLSAIFACTSFIILVIDGGKAFIATDILLAFIIIHNFFAIVRHSITHIFKITVELRGCRSDGWHDLGRGKKGAQPGKHIDIVLAVFLVICLIIGNACINRWQSGTWKVGLILGYVVV
jgi:hypothetical protein